MIFLHRRGANAEMASQPETNWKNELDLKLELREMAFEKVEATKSAPEFPIGSFNNISRDGKVDMGRLPLPVKSESSPQLSSMKAGISLGTETDSDKSKEYMGHEQIDITGLESWTEMDEWDEEPLGLDTAGSPGDTSLIESEGDLMKQPGGGNVMGVELEIGDEENNFEILLTDLNDWSDWDETEVDEIGRVSSGEKTEKMLRSSVQSIQSPSTGLQSSKKRKLLWSGNLEAPEMSCCQSMSKGGSRRTCCTSPSFKTDESNEWPEHIELEQMDLDQMEVDNIVLFEELTQINNWSEDNWNT